MYLLKKCVQSQSGGFEGGCARNILWAKASFRESPCLQGHWSSVTSGPSAFRDKIANATQLVSVKIYEVASNKRLSLCDTLPEWKYCFLSLTSSQDETQREHFTQNNSSMWPIQACYSQIWLNGAHEVDLPPPCSAKLGQRGMIYQGFPPPSVDWRCCLRQPSVQFLGAEVPYGTFATALGQLTQHGSTQGHLYSRLCPLL